MVGVYGGGWGSRGWVGVRTGVGVGWGPGRGGGGVWAVGGGGGVVLHTI